jgi:hypothetical protein
LIIARTTGIWLYRNINGPSRAFMSAAGQAGYLNVTLPDTVGSVAAKIQVTRSDGKIIHRDFVSGEGLCSDQSHLQIFGLDDTEAAAIKVRYIDGREEERIGSFKNELVVF